MQIEMLHQRFRFKNSRELLQKAEELGLDLPFSEDISPLFTPVSIGERSIENRFVVQPMEGYDSLPDGSPSELTGRRYIRYAEGGSGLIWFEAIASRRDGKSNPRQLMITSENVSSFRNLLSEIKERAEIKNRLYMVAQVTHSGRYSRPEGISAPLVPQNNPVLDKGAPVVLSDSDLAEIEDSMLQSAELVHDAGFDAVDIKACHGYLVHELLSARNRKNSMFGGAEPASRFRFLAGILKKIKERIPELTVTTRLSISDLIPGGFGTSPDGFKPDLTEPLLLIGELKKTGVELINITMGSPYYNPHVVRPFDTALPGNNKPDEHPLTGVIRLIGATAIIQNSFPGMKVVGSGYSWLRQFIPNTGAAVLKSGGATFVGLGRSSFAYPSLPLDLKMHGRADPDKVCVTCSGCSRLINNLRPGGCVTHDREIYGKELKKLIRDGK